MGEAYLKSVLTYSVSLGVIRSYQIDRGARQVVLRTGATTTTLSYWEALEYLSNAMLYELRPDPVEVH